MLADYAITPLYNDNGSSNFATPNGCDVIINGH